MPYETAADTPWAVAIRVERVRRRLKQEQVAEKAGLDQGTVSRAESGRGSAEVYAAIAAALEIELPEAGE
jgi:transcriptional regulator with XRE-family HTH domain